VLISGTVAHKDMYFSNVCVKKVIGYLIKLKKIVKMFKMYCSTVQWPAKKVSHHLNVSVIKALITHLDFDVTER
jgi:hypothetical protein